MPQRILRDWTDSHTIDKLSYEEEVLFTRLIMKADDYGNFHAKPQIVKSLLFPLKDGIRVSDMTRWLDNLEAAGLIRIYTVKEVCYLTIINFGQRLRTKKRIFPDQEKNMSASCQQIDSSMSSEEKRRDIEVEDEVKRSPPSENFEFLSLYDCKTQYLKIQGAAIDAICISKNLKREKIPFWLDEFKKHLVKEGTERKIYSDYVKHFSRWINLQNTNNNSQNTNHDEKL